MEMSWFFFSMSVPATVLEFEHVVAIVNGVVSYVA